MGQRTSSATATAATAPGGERNARGEWRPPYGITYAPVITWPPRPLEFIKWVFSWPGFIWPRNIALLLIPLVCWLWFTPALSRCTEFRAGWMLEVFLRNQALIWGFYGGYYVLLYILKIEGDRGKYDARWPERNSKKFLFHDQVYDNIFWTAGVATTIWSGYEIVTLWAYANKFIPMLTWQEHPIAFVAWFLAIPFWREFHFYWVHRLIHVKALYRRVHALHHKNINPNPWSGMAMHPIESLLYLSVCVIHWIIPSHPLHFLFTLQHAALGPACGHHGFEGPILKGMLPTGSYFHYLHHRYFECNYGGETWPLDKWFGTFRDGLPDGAGANLPGEHK